MSSLAGRCSRRVPVTEISGARSQAMRTGGTALAVVMLMVAACGGRDADTLVEYSGASNGVMRWTYEMRVGEDGSLSVASDQNCAGGKAEAQLDSEAMARLRSVLGAARLGEKQSVHEPGVNPREFEIW